MGPMCIVCRFVLTKYQHNTKQQLAPLLLIESERNERERERERENRLEPTAAKPNLIQPKYFKHNAHA